MSIITALTKITAAVSDADVLIKLCKAGLVRKAIEKDEITMSRGAEILRLDLEAMREIVSS